MKKGQSEGKDAKIRVPALLFSARLSFFMTSFFWMLIGLLLRGNINFAIICMLKVSHVPNNATGEIHEIENGEELTEESALACPSVLANHTNSTIQTYEGEFEWGKATQSNILGAFFYGFMFTNVVGGWVSDKFGGKKGFIGSMVAITLLTFLCPIASEQGPEWLFVVRFLQGTSQGAAMPLANVLAARWSGSIERSFLVGITYAGFTVGAFVTNPLSAFICKNLGWRYIFYFSGMLGLIWSSLSWFLVFDWPEDHPRISQEELEFLQRTRAVQPGTQNNNARHKLNVPWKSILFSVPINVVHITHFCSIWALILLMMFIPQYFKEVLKMDVGRNGMLSSIPFFGMLILHLFTGSLFDALRRRNICSVTNLRKIFQAVGISVFTIAICLLSLIPCKENTTQIVFILLGTSFLKVAMMGGYLLSIFELAPRYAGIVTGISNTLGVLPGFICPAVVGYLTQNGTKDEWMRVFYIGGAVCSGGMLIYVLFGSSELQHWASPQNKPKETEMADLKQKLMPTDNGGEEKVSQNPP